MTSNNVNNWDRGDIPNFRWRMATILAAKDYGVFFERDKVLYFSLLCNDVFGPCADSEDVSPEELTEIWYPERLDDKDYWRTVCSFIAKKRGHKDTENFWCDRYKAK